MAWRFIMEWLPFFYKTPFYHQRSPRPPHCLMHDASKTSIFAGGGALLMLRLVFCEHHQLMHLSSCSVAGAPGRPIPLSIVVRPSLRWSVNLTSSVSWQFLVRMTFISQSNLSNQNSFVIVVMLAYGTNSKLSNECANIWKCIEPR